MSDAGKAAPNVILGAAALATAIASFGAGIAGAVYIIGKSLPSLATGLRSFNDIDGKNLQQAGIGMAGLGIGITGMGVGAIANAMGTIVRFFTGDKDPLTQSSEMLHRLEKVNLNRKKIEDNGASLMAFAKAMAAVSALGAGAGIADAVKGVYGGISKLFGVKPPYKDLETFSRLKVDTANVKTNSDSFVYFTKAMASYKGTEGGLSGITSSLAQATVSFFKAKPPEEKVESFSRLKINPKQTKINSASFVLFSQSMASYKGGAGLISAISTIVGAKLSQMFGVAGPLESFKKFADIDVGPKASANAQAFLNFSKAMGLLSGGSGGLLGDLAAGAGAVAGAVVGAVAGAATVAGQALGIIPGPDQKAMAFIGKIESGGDYNKLVGGKTKKDPPLTSMTVSQVMEFQSGMIAKGHESTALGKYQIIKPTLAGLVKSGKVSAGSKFDQSTQDQAALSLMKARGRDKFRKGDIPVDSYANNLAKEWASLPMPNGKSFYAGTGSNKSLVARPDFVNSLQAKTGGMFKGPTGGYPIELHGTELVIPLDSNSILNKLASNSADSVAKELQRNVSKVVPKPTSTTGTPKKTKGISKEMIYSMSAKFDNVINKIESTNSVQKKLLKQVF